MNGHLQGQWLLKARQFAILLLFYVCSSVSRLFATYLFNLNGVIYVVPNIFCLHFFPASSLMVSISSTVHFFCSFYKCNCNRIKHATYFDCMGHICTLSVQTHNDKLFPLTNAGKKRKWKKKSLKIVELNCIENRANANGKSSEKMFHVRKMWY